MSNIYTITKTIKNRLPRSIFDRALKIVNFRNLRNQSEVSLFQIFKSILFNKFIQDGQFILSNYGVWILNNTKDKSFHLACMGYRNKLDNILRKIKVPIIFLDIGANQGIFSLVAAKNPQIKEVHAFEPNQNICKILKKNFHRNRINKFIIHKKAISRYNGIRFLSFTRSHSGKSKITKTTLNSMKIDSVNRDYLNTKFVNSDLPFFLKIDVEGMEYEVLKEVFSSVLKKQIYYIFIELRNDEKKNKKTIDLLIENSFTKTFTTKFNMNDTLFEKFKMNL